MKGLRVVLARKAENFSFGDRMAADFQCFTNMEVFEEVLVSHRRDPVDLLRIVESDAKKRRSGTRAGSRRDVLEPRAGTTPATRVAVVQIKSITLFRSRKTARIIT